MHLVTLITIFFILYRHLPLNDKRASDAINIILKLFETIARDLTSINVVQADSRADSSDSEETVSGGSDVGDVNGEENSDGGEGNGEENSDGENSDGNDVQIRTSTPISEDELEHEAVADMHNDRVLEETHPDEDEEEEEEDEEMNEDEVLVEPDEDDVSEFEEVLTQYLDEVDIDDRNELRPRDMGRFSIEGDRGIFLFFKINYLGHMAMFARPNINRGAFRFTPARPTGGNNPLIGDQESIFGTAGIPQHLSSNFHHFINTNSNGLSFGTSVDTGLERSRQFENREVVEAAIQHPLLRRPQNSRINTVSQILSTAGNATLNTPTLGPFSMNQLHRVRENILGIRARHDRDRDNYHEDATLQRLMATSNNRRAQGLRRQGALRRWHPLGNGQQMGTSHQAARFLTRIIDENLFPEMNVYRPYEDSSREASSERRLIETLIPYYLDRIYDHTQLLDVQSIYYVSVLIAAYLTEKLIVKKPEKTVEKQESRPEENLDTVREVPEETISEEQPSVSVEPDSIAVEENLDTVREVPEETISEEQRSVSVEPDSIAVEENLDAAREVAEEAISEEQPGVDPDFLAALPADIREEVIRDYRRQQRAQRLSQMQEQANQRRRAQMEAASSVVVVADNSAAAPAEVPPEEVLDQEFLAALPPELQEEVLAQHEQRITERNRLNNPPATEETNNAAGVDIDAVFESLPPGLRAQVLADADDSVLQILPPNLLAEANRLRANFEQQQVFRFARMLDRPMAFRTQNNPRALQTAQGIASGVNNEERGIQIFDRESIVTIMLLYFLDHEKFSLLRIQVRIFFNDNIYV